MAETDLVETLRQILKDRQKINPRYTIMEFAETLGIHDSSLSQILRGKRVLGRRLGAEIAGRLGVPYQPPAPNKRPPAPKSDFELISPEKFKMISQWYHWAILELFSIKGFQNDPVWMAQKLSLTESKVLEALEQLKETKMLIEINGQLEPRNSHSTNIPPQMMTSEVLRDFLHQMIQKSDSAIDQIDIQQRNHSTMMIPASSEDLAFVSDKIKKFRRHLTEQLTARGASKDRVYALNISYFPITE